MSTHNAFDDLPVAESITDADYKPLPVTPTTPQAPRRVATTLNPHWLRLVETHRHHNELLHLAQALGGYGTAQAQRELADINGVIRAKAVALHYFPLPVTERWMALTI